MRAFLALPMPDAAVTALERLQQEIPIGRLVPPENLHLTLLFLGERSEAALEELHFALEALRAPGFDLRLSGLDMFDRADPAALHIGVPPCPALEALQARLRAVAHGAGIMLERSRFRPHVTLARFNRGLGPDQAARLGRFLAARGDFALPAFAVRGFTLYESILTKDGSVYEVLADYPLAAMH
jgi:2'-5' RNA ligase